MAELTEGAVVGTWSGVDEGVRTTLVLEPDDKFSVTDLPAMVLDYDGRGTLNLEGRWRISDSDYAGAPLIDLDAADEDPDDGTNGPQIPLLARISDGQLTLFFILGDPDSSDWLDVQLVA